MFTVISIDPSRRVYVPDASPTKDFVATSAEKGASRWNVNQSESPGGFLTSSSSNIRSLASAILGWFVLATSALAQDGAAIEIAELPLSSIPYVELPALMVNVENTHRGLVHADEDTGIAQISAMLTRTSFEEQWAYIPAIGVWIEVGSNEVASGSEAEVEIDVDYVDKLVTLFRRVHLYHPHPAAYFSGASWQQRPVAVDLPADRFARNDLPSIGLALPSPADIAVSIELSELMFIQHPGATVTHSVVTPYGVVTYGPTARGLKRMLFEKGSPRSSIARMVVTTTAIRRGRVNVARTTALLGNPTITEVIHDLSAQGSDENYRINFTPRSSVRHALSP